MQNKIALFVKKTYKLFSVFIFVILFFVIYNTYLLDHSLINLKAALNRAAEAKTAEDLERLRPFLKIPLLKAIAKKSLSKELLISLETIDNIASSPKSEKQIEDIKFYLKSAIKTIEKERGGVLSALDNLTGRVVRPEVKLSKENLEARARAIEDKLRVTKDKELLLNLYYGLGNIYMELTDLPKAEEAFLTVVKIDPQNPLAIKARFNLAWAYKTAGQYEKAKVYFGQLSKEFPGIDLAVASQYEVADTLYKQGDYEQARDKYAQLAREYPEVGLGDFALSQAGYISFYNLNDRETAAKYFSQLEEDYSQTELSKHASTKTIEAMASTFREEGFQLIKEKEYFKAIETFEKAIKIFPLDSRSVSGMGLSYYWLGNKTEALDKAEKAVHISTIPDEVTLINSLFIYINSGKIDEAIQIGEGALSEITVPRAEFYYNLGYAYVLKSQIDKAILQFKRAIRVNPDLIFAYNNLACVLWMRRQYDEAIKEFKQAIDRVPEYEDAHFNLGIVYFNLNRLEDAYKEFKIALQINLNNKQAQNYINRIVEILKYNP